MNGLARMVALAALALLGPALAGAQQPWILKEGQHHMKFASKDPAMLGGGFLLFLPKGYEQGKWPLVVFLHGRAESGTNLDEMRKRGGLPRWVDRNPDFGFIVASPQLPGTAHWFDPAALNDFLDQLLARLPMIDAERIYLSGISMGGAGAWTWAAASPERFAAVVPIAGTFFDAERSCALKSLPIWAFHNDLDPVVGVEKSEKLIGAVNACGGSAKLTVFPNRQAHDAWSAAYAKPDLFEWLLSHKRRAPQ
ncbi:MAG TPA: alpha/beta fold hydrolase [Usitatibacter sp.]|nr:alpha/beta fold hydrolase [Usitatibacter sp.]